MFGLLVSAIVICVGVRLIKDGSTNIIDFIRNLFGKE